MPKALFVMTVALDFRAFLLPIAAHFRRKGWQIDGASAEITYNADCQQGFDQIFDIEWSRNPLKVGNFLKGLSQIRELVERQGYDIVHVHTPVAAFLTRLALRDLRKKGHTKVIYTAHGFHFHPGGNPIKNLIFMAAERLAANWTDYLVVINRTDEAAARRYIMPSERVVYMPGIGVDTRHYGPEFVAQADVKRVRDEMGLKEGQPLFLMIAELNPGKRHRDALAAFAKLGREDVHLAFAGIGPLQEEIQKQIADLGLKDQVHLLGYRRDIPALIRASVATLLPSEREGLPRAIMESLSLEVPAIGTQIRGVKDLIEGGCGILTPVGDQEAMTQAMSYILEHPAEARAMGKKGRERMAAYDTQHIIALHEELYGRALGMTKAALVNA